MGAAERPHGFMAAGVLRSDGVLCWMHAGMRVFVYVRRRRYSELDCAGCMVVAAGCAEAESRPALGPASSEGSGPSFVQGVGIGAGYCVGWSTGFPWPASTCFRQAMGCNCALTSSSKPADLA